MDESKYELAFPLQEIADILIEAGCFKEWDWPDLTGLNEVNAKLYRALELAKLQAASSDPSQGQPESYRLQ